MDSFADVFGLGGVLTGMGGIAETFICIVVAMLVLRIELQRRAVTGPNFGSRQGSGYAEGCHRILRQCAPEAAGIIACLTLAAALRARGDLTSTAGVADEAAWAQIKADWPLLITADTLLALQAMLRFIVLVSVALRCDGTRTVPLADEVGALWLGAGLARLVTGSRASAYSLDGPLGGTLPWACEIAVIPLLFVVGRSTLRRAPCTMAAIVAATAIFAGRNRLNLASDTMADSCFTAAHCMDFLASLAYLLRTLLVDSGPRGSTAHISMGFVHLLMPIQQSLSAYYFVNAFEASPALVGAGHPFAMLQIGNVAQFGAYLGAASLYLAECFDGQEHCISNQEVGEQLTTGAGGNTGGRALVSPASQPQTAF